MADPLPPKNAAKLSQSFDSLAKRDKEASTRPLNVETADSARLEGSAPYEIAMKNIPPTKGGGAERQGVVCSAFPNRSRQPPEGYTTAVVSPSFPLS